MRRAPDSSYFAHGVQVEAFPRKHSPFSIEDRIGLVDDAFALSKAGYSDVSSALALTDVLRNESECQ